MQKKKNSSKLLNLSNILLALIILAALFVRTYKLSDIPPGVHRDEALFAYDAYSILKTARDQHGKFLPLTFEGFGLTDYPLAIYPRIPFVFLFGLNAFSVRFGVVFYSIITIFLTYKLAQKMFTNDAVALLSAFFAAFSSWHFFHSRTGLAMHALLLLLLGTYLVLYAKKKWQNIAGGISLGLTCFTYAAYFFFMPAFLLVLTAMFFKDIKRDKGKALGLLAAFITVALAFILFREASLKRAPQAAFYYNDTGIVFEWSDKPVGEILARGKTYDKLEWFLHNPRFAYAYKAALNYFGSYSPTYWMKSGSGMGWNVEGFGNLLLYEPFLILTGILVLVWKRSKEGIFLLGWILAGPLATTFTKDVASTRLLHMTTPFILLQAVAVKHLWEQATKLKPKILLLPIVVLATTPVLFLNTLYFDGYFRHFPAYAGKWWFNGYSDVFALTNKYPQKNVYIASGGDLAYIITLFQTKYDPDLFRKEAQWSQTVLNISYVTNFGRYNFIDKIERDSVCKDDNSIYIWKQEPNKEAPFTPDGIINNLGSDQFYYFIPSAQNCPNL